MPNLESFPLVFEVRDYECDLQGIVNNAVYQHYLEHARHQFLKRHGFNFAQLAKRGINLVVVRAEVDYKFPLVSGDVFVVESRLVRLSLVRFAFLQDIFRPPDRKLILKARVVCAAMDKIGKPIVPKVLEPLFQAASDLKKRNSLIGKIPLCRLLATDNQELP